MSPKKTFLWDENKMQWYFDGVLKRTETNPGQSIIIFNFKSLLLSYNPYDMGHI